MSQEAGSELGTVHHSDCFKFGLTVKHTPFRRKCYLVSALGFLEELHNLATNVSLILPAFQ